MKGCRPGTGRRRRQHRGDRDARSAALLKQHQGGLRNRQDRSVRLRLDDPISERELDVLEALMEPFLQKLFAEDSFAPEPAE